MKIDEHIKHIQGTIEWAKAFGGEDDDDLIKVWTELLEMLEELKWYREHDLIRREDVIPKPKYCKSHNIAECRNTSCPNCWEETIMQIPKAEPKKKETLNEIRAKYGLAPISASNWDEVTNEMPDFIRQRLVCEPLSKKEVIRILGYDNED